MRKVPHILAALFAIAAASATAGQASAEGANDLEKRFERTAGRIRQAVAAVPRDELSNRHALARAALAADKAGTLLGRYRFGFARNRLAEQEIAKAEQFLEDPASLTPEPSPGFHELAYISEIDLSPQPYLLYVPEAYDGETPLPLLVFLHGYAFDLNKVNWIEYMYSPSLEQVCEELGFALLLPYGRSNTEFMGIGESDVLRTIELAKEFMPIDARRVVISGASMGGSGAYSIACHHPHLFAGVFTVTGRVCYYQWMNIVRSDLPRFKQAQVDVDYARELLGNLLHVPVFIGHGERDHLLDVEQSRLMTRLLRERGQDVRFVEFPGEGHYIWSRTFEHPDLIERLEEWRSPAAPERVQFTTYSLKYPRAYWVAIEDIVLWGKPAEVTAEIMEGNSIAVAASNVTALSLRPPAELVDMAEGVMVSVNGAPTQRVKPGEGGALRVPVPGAEQRTGGGLRKTPAMSGPAREAYDGPFIVVVPTQPGPNLKRDQQNAQTVAQEWRGYAQGTARVKQDKDIGESDARNYNLILVGGPETNAYLARIAEELPIRIGKDAYRVGDRTFPREGNGLIMIYPNPENPERYVLVRDGVHWGRTLQINHKMGFLPDFIVYSQEIDRDGTMFETNQYLCAGYFDSGWRLDPKSFWIYK